MAYKFSGELQQDWEHCQDTASGKSLLLVRMFSFDINADRAQPKYFIAYDVPCPNGNVLPEGLKPVEVTGEFGARLAFKMLHEYING